MPKFNVTLEEKIRYTITVEAETAAAAAHVAEEVFVQSDDPFKDFVSHVEDRGVLNILPAPDSADVDQIDDSQNSFQLWKRLREGSPR